MRKQLQQFSFSLKPKYCQFFCSSKKYLSVIFYQRSKMIHQLWESFFLFLKLWSTKSMVLRKKGYSDILMKSQTVCMHSNSLSKKGQYARTNCIHFFNKTYQNNLCSLALQIGLFYLMNLKAYKQFGCSSKCQIGPFCTTPS